MIHLGLDTASPRGSVALARSGAVAAEAPLLERGAHARDLLGRIDALLVSVGVAIGDLAGIGVAAGPGSFTGIRVGMATAKGLAYALGIGLSGISTLEAIARAARGALAEPPAGIGAVIEAGRGELYAALFRVGAGDLSRQTPDRSMRPADILVMMPEEYVIAGDGVEALLDAASKAGRRPAEAVRDLPPLAGSIALWAAASIAKGAGYHAQGMGPNYVRPADAEAKRRRP